MEARALCIRILLRLTPAHNGRGFCFEADNRCGRDEIHRELNNTYGEMGDGYASGEVDSFSCYIDRDPE